MPWGVEPVPQQVVPKTGWQLEDDYQQRDFENALQRAAATRTTGAVSVAPDSGNDLNSQRFAAQLAMTPGVRTPGSPGGYNLLDSPALQPKHFAGPGGDYTFDPAAAAEQEGATAGLQQNRQDSTRFAALTAVPGIDSRMAARLVYGRSGIMDRPDPMDTDSALAAYAANPSSDTAAAALKAGASANTFGYLNELEPDPRHPGGSFVTRPKAPVPGTPEYDALEQRREDIRVGGISKEIKLRADLAPKKTDTATQQFARKKYLLAQVATLSGGDVGKGFDAIAADPKMRAEAEALGIADSEVQAAVQNFRNTQTNRDTKTAASIYTSGMAPTAEEAAATVPRLRGGAGAPGTIATPQRASWDRAMGVINAKRQGGQALTPIEEQFLREHPNRP